LAVGAIVRALWLRYRITNRRITVTGGWQGRDRTDIIYSEIVKIVKVPRGLGFWGDMVLTLRDGSRLELRAVPKFREIYDYINEKIAAKNLKVSSAVKV
jgi:nitrogen fixation protein